jgi:hypothetical protein
MRSAYLARATCWLVSQRDRSLPARRSVARRGAGRRGRPHAVNCRLHVVRTDGSDGSERATGTWERREGKGREGKGGRREGGGLGRVVLRSPSAVSTNISSRPVTGFTCVTVRAGVRSHPAVPATGFTHCHHLPPPYHPYHHPYHPYHRLQRGATRAEAWCNEGVLWGQQAMVTRLLTAIPIIPWATPFTKPLMPPCRAPAVPTRLN